MSRLSRLSRRAGATLVLGLGLATAATAQPATPRGLDARLDRVAERLDLSTTQRGQLEALAARTGDPTVADLWYVTGDLHGLLTPEQRAALTAGNAQSADRVRGERGRGAARAHHRRAHRSDRERRPERSRDQADPDRADTRAAQRQAVKAARTRVLGLTEAQEERFEALRLGHAARPDRAAGQGEPRDLVLTERQQELLALHRVLVGRSGRAHRRGGPSRR